MHAPKETSAVRAIAYPIGGSFKVPHRVSNPMLLPHVMRVYLTSCALRYVRVAEAVGEAGAREIYRRTHRA